MESDKTWSPWESRIAISLALLRVMPLEPGEPSLVARDTRSNDLCGMSKPVSSDGEDPLHNDTILLHGLRIAEPGDNASNTIRKVPSDQIFSMFRWGYVHVYPVG